MTAEDFQPVADAADLPDGTQLAVELEGRKVLLINKADTIHAVENQCTHMDMDLEGCRVRKGRLICPHHGAGFELESGKAVGAPAVKTLCVFPVKQENGKILIKLVDRPEYEGGKKSPGAIPGMRPKF